MQIKIRVITNAKKSLIKKEGDIFKIYIPVIPEKGKANKALIKLLAKYYNVSKSNIIITKGEKSKNKIIEIKK